MLGGASYLWPYLLTQPAFSFVDSHGVFFPQKTEPKSGDANKQDGSGGIKLGKIAKARGDVSGTKARVSVIRGWSWIVSCVRCRWCVFVCIEKCCRLCASSVFGHRFGEAARCDPEGLPQHGSPWTIHGECPGDIRTSGIDIASTAVRTSTTAHLVLITAVVLECRSTCMRT